MNRVGGLFERIAEPATLARAVWNASRGKRARIAVHGFLQRAPLEFIDLARLLSSGEFQFQSYTSFEIRDPKSRVIRAPSFRDRVVHHAIIDVCGPVFERGAIQQSCACRQGRGQQLALILARKWARDSEWFLKLDVAKFYDSISHAYLRRQLSRRFRETKLLQLFDRLLASYQTCPGHGLPIGALTSQYLGNFVLDPVDHWVQERGRTRRYLRYMDDMLVFGRYDELRRLKQGMTAELDRMGLRVKQGGVLNRVSLGVPWLGFTIYPNRMRLNRLGRRRLRRRWRALERVRCSGAIHTMDAQARATALFAHARLADDRVWRNALVAPRRGEALETGQPSDARRLLEQPSQELPFCLSEQEQPEEHERQPGLPGLLAPWHEGAIAWIRELPSDDVLSRARAALGGRDEFPGRASVDADIQRAECPEEKASAEALPTQGGDCCEL